MTAPELIRYNLKRLIAADGRTLEAIAMAAFPGLAQNMARQRLLRARKSGASRYLADFARALGCKPDAFLLEPH
jgi:hypothetical protein